MSNTIWVLKGKLINVLGAVGVLWITLFLAPPSQAQEKEEEIELEEVVVTAHPLEDTEIEISQPASVLGRRDLLTKDTRNVGDVVAEELGVSSSDFGPAVGRPIIRGLGEGRVRVLEDGIGPLDVSDISPDHAVAIEPLFAEQIEIFRGPATLLYGSGASGGIVNVVNHRILDYVPEGIEGSLYSHYNSVANDATGAFRLNAGAGPLVLHADGLKQSTGDYGIPGFAAVHPEPDAPRGILPNSDVQTESLAGGVSMVGARGFLGFSVSHLAKDVGIPIVHGHEDVEGHRIRADLEQTRFDIKGALHNSLPGFHTIKTRWGYNDHTLKELEAGRLTALLNNKEWEGRVEFLHQPLGAWEGVLGFQYRNRDLASRGDAFVPSSQAEIFSVFVLEQRNWRRWHFQAGGRFEHQDSEQRQAQLTAHYDLFDVSGGALWEFMEGYFMGITLSHSQRAPALEELFSAGPHHATHTFDIGNPNLNKETSNNVDLSLRRRYGHWSWTFNLFANYIDNFIFLQEAQVGADFPERINTARGRAEDLEGLRLLNYSQGDAEFLGGEFETVVGLLHGARGQLDLRLWTDYVRGKLADGSNLPRITPLRFGGELDYARGPWHAGIDIMRVQRQDKAAPLETPTEGYAMLNADIEYSLVRGPVEYTLFLRGTNLLNDEARRHTSFLKDRAPLPGRSGMIGLTATF
jgi:iron complex outermembrane recepter protein